MIAIISVLLHHLFEGPRKLTESDRIIYQTNQDGAKP